MARPESNQSVMKNCLPTIVANGARYPQTTITIHQSTRNLLESVKASGQTNDDLLRELVGVRYPPELLDGLKRRTALKPGGRMDDEVYRGPLR